MPQHLLCHVLHCYVFRSTTSFYYVLHLNNGGASSVTGAAVFECCIRPALIMPT